MVKEEEEEYCSLLPVGVALDLKIFSFSDWIMVMIMKHMERRKRTRKGKCTVLCYLILNWSRNVSYCSQQSDLFFLVVSFPHWVIKEECYSLLSHKVALDLGKTLVCSSDLFLRLAVSDLSLLLAVSFPHLITMAKIESIRCFHESDRKRRSQELESLIYFCCCVDKLPSAKIPRTSLRTDQHYLNEALDSSSYL